MADAGRTDPNHFKRRRMTDNDLTTDALAHDSGQLDEVAGKSANRGIGEVLAPWFNSDRRMFTALGLLALTWAVILGRLIVLRHNRFGTFDFDEGIQDQLIWQVAHFRQFTTVRGVPFLGNHASFGFFLLAPLVWLGGGPNTWNLLNAFALATGAMVLYLIARDKLGKPWLSLIVGVVWLAQPSVQWWVQEGFHPECVALPFLFATYLFGERIVARTRAGVPVGRRLKWQFAASMFLTIIWKEDLALALVGMGLVWIVRRQWKLGLRVVVVAALWFAIFGAWMVPHFAKGTVYGGIYGNLGTTPSQVVTTSATHPSRLLKRLDDNHALGYSRQLQQGFGYVTLLSPVTWLIGAPQWTIDIVSTANFTWDMKYHYQAIPLAALAISFIEGLVFLRRRRRWLAEAAVLVGLGAALYCGRVYGPGPWSIDYRAGYWPLTVPSTQAANTELVKKIAVGQGVSADYLLVPHLTHRQIIYTFPNPWINSNYGVTPTAHGDPARVQWIGMDTTMLSARDAALFTSIEMSGEFRVALHQGPIILLQRVKPPGRGLHPIGVPAG